MARRILFSMLGFGCLTISTPARAHVSFEQAGTHRSRYGDDEIKDGPCGRANGKRGANIYTYKPGQTITIKLKETVPHPGYFRIAFDPDGDDDFIEPRSIKPVDPKRGCLNDGIDKCGLTDDFQDFYNSDAVLMDNLAPHVPTSYDAQVYTWQVKLPNVTCDNCTLQVIQVMEDHGFHGPYSPKGASQELLYVEDIYHSCIDIVLKADADETTNPPPSDGDGDGVAGEHGDAPDHLSDGGVQGSGDGDGDGDTGTHEAESGSTDPGSAPSAPVGTSPSCSVGLPTEPYRTWLGPAFASLLGCLALSRRRRART